MPPIISRSMCLHLVSLALGVPARPQPAQAYVDHNSDDDAVYAALYDESQWCLTGSPPECWGPIVIASTVAIVDSSGVEAVRSGGAWIPMEVQFANVISMYIHFVDIGLATERQCPLGGTLITALQVVACSVGIDDLLINVSSTTLMPFAPPQRPAEVLWRNFSWPDNRFLDDPRKYVVGLLFAHQVSLIEM